jgi:hypothetical protein
MVRIVHGENALPTKQPELLDDNIGSDRGGYDDNAIVHVIFLESWRRILAWSLSSTLFFFFCRGRSAFSCDYCHFFVVSCRSSSWRPTEQQQTALSY